MSKPEIILVGAGGHARACIDVIELEGHYRIVGLVALPHEFDESYRGYDFIATDEDIPDLALDYNYAVVTVGQIKFPDIRVRLYEQLKEAGLILPVIVSPRAYVSRDATIGEGTFVMHDALINAGARIGVNCIINTKALVEHDAVVGGHCHVSTGAIVNGGAVISEKTFIGSNAMISNSIEVGDNQIVSGGETILRSINDD